MSDTIKVGGMELRFHHSRETGASIDLFEMIVLPAGAMPVPHYHESWDETVYGLLGTTTFHIDGVDVDIGPGETAFIRRGVVHGFVNRSGSPATTLVMLSPGALGPAYFREIGAMVATGAPDKAAVEALMRRYGLIPTW